MLPSTPSHHPSAISLHLSIFTSSSSTLTSSLFPLLPSLLSSSDKASLPPTPPPLLVYVGRVYVLSPIITTSLPVLHPYSSRLFRNTCEEGGCVCVGGGACYHLPCSTFQLVSSTFSLCNTDSFFLTNSSPLFDSFFPTLPPPSHCHLHHCVFHLLPPSSSFMPSAILFHHHLSP